MKRISIYILLFLASSVFATKPIDSIQKWKVKGQFNFVFNQSSFSNWTSGGSNTISGNIGVNYDFNYKSGKWNWDNKFISNYGLSYVSGKETRKTSDRMEFNSLLGKKSSKYWFTSALLNFKSQYTRGYNYKKTPKEATSSALSPAYLIFGPGMLWKKSDDIRINIAPATSRFTFVSSQFSGKYGVDEGETTKFGLGFSLSAYYKFKLFENVEMENIFALYSDYLKQPENIDIDYQTNFHVPLNSFLSLKMRFHTIFDDNASSRVQFKQVFGLGVNYTFHKR